MQGGDLVTPSPATTTTCLTSTFPVTFGLSCLFQPLHGHEWLHFLRYWVCSSVWPCSCIPYSAPSFCLAHIYAQQLYGSEKAILHMFLHDSERDALAQFVVLTSSHKQLIESIQFVLSQFKQDTLWIIPTIYSMYVYVSFQPLLVVHCDDSSSICGVLFQSIIPPTTWFILHIMLKCVHF